MNLITAHTSALSHPAPALATQGPPEPQRRPDRHCSLSTQTTPSAQPSRVHMPLRASLAEQHEHGTRHLTLRPLERRHVLRPVQEPHLLELLELRPQRLRAPMYNAEDMGARRRWGRSSSSSSRWGS
eukprot:NODE_4654_length_780_cov_35.757866_g4310_i0.p2 GENE.NODE_4654_length_780_cov_35.757866_g4310_i0~~NODE_4654_length_780_cov_35.757866_g4310_i0.p2  ORF type:complete len:127 (-),score=6.76 NODE_4654_length_780_cov_35.757866_g4310_i0:323-703(-)